MYTFKLLHFAFHFSLILYQSRSFLMPMTGWTSNPLSPIPDIQLLFLIPPCPSFYVLFGVYDLCVAYLANYSIYLLWVISYGASDGFPSQHGITKDAQVCLLTTMYSLTFLILHSMNQLSDYSIKQRMVVWGILICCTLLQISSSNSMFFSLFCRRH